MKIKGADNQGKGQTRTSYRTPQPTFCTTTKKNARKNDVTSCSQLPVKRPHQRDIVQLPVGCVHALPPLRVTFGQRQPCTCTTTLVVIQNVPVAHAHTINESLPVKRPHQGYCETSVVHAHSILPIPGRASSGHVTSGCSPLFPQKYDCPYPYTTHVSSFK